MKDWKEKGSEQEKLEALGVARGAVRRDTYHWYFLGDIAELWDDDKNAITRECFIELPRGGDFNIQRSRGLEGAPWVLRLRGDLRTVPGLTIRGQYCPLFQVRRSGASGTTPADLLTFVE